jgi:hypothetical protein
MQRARHSSVAGKHPKRLLERLAQKFNFFFIIYPHLGILYTYWHFTQKYSEKK